VGKQADIRWLKKPQADNYPAAQSFLSLIVGRKAAKKLVRELGESAPVDFKAIDVLRASGETLLDVTNAHVKDNHQKILGGKALSPLLLVAHPESGRVLIADGYHRLCAAYSFDEDAAVPCRLVVKPL
jgi:hypothetical protein